MDTIKRKHIIVTAMELFNEYGFHATPTSRIAKKAKVSVGTLFNYFETKEAIHKGTWKIKSKVTKIMKYRGLVRVDATEAIAGDIISIAGIETVEVGETLACVKQPKGLPAIKIDEPTISMNFSHNTSPLTGKDGGRFLTSRHMRERLEHEAMINVAKEKFRDSELIEFKKEDCFNLSFADNSFDTIFMANLLHVIPTPEKALEECKRVLRSNGNLIILSFTMHGMSFFNKVGMFYRYIKTYGKPPKESSVLTIQIVKNMLDKLGFVTEKIELIGNKMKSVYAIAKNK
jgi:hypothetical protein